MRWHTVSRHGQTILKNAAENRDFQHQRVNGRLPTLLRFDGLIDAKFALEAQYWPTAKFIPHPQSLKRITKLKDGEGQYLWRQSVRDGEPDTLLGFGVIPSEFDPSTLKLG